MNFYRRALGAGLIAAALGVTAPLPAQAQDKPVIRLLVGYPAGSGSDNLARIYADALTRLLNVTVIVDNRPGAGGQIAGQALKAATPDSNTLMFTADHQVVMIPLVIKTPGYDVKKDMVPVGRIVNFYTCLAVPASSPAHNFNEYLDAVRKDASLGNFAIPAPGSQPQFVGYVISQHFKVPMNPVPYKGGAPAITDLIGAQVPAAAVPCDALVEYRKAGKVRVLAVAADKRYSAMPDVQTFAELGLKMPADNFIAVYAAANLKPDLLRQITEATRKMFDAPDTVAKFASTYMEPSYASPQELEAFVDNASAFWAEQVRKSNFQAQ